MIHRVVLAGLSWCILVCLEFSLHEKQPNHRKKLQIYKFTTNLDQSKQTVGVKKPSLSSVSTELFLSDMCLFVLSFLEHIEFVLKVPVLFHFVYFLFVEDSLKSLEFYTFLPTDSFCLWIRPISTISDTPYLLFSLCIFWVEGFISFFDPVENSSPVFPAIFLYLVPDRWSENKKNYVFKSSVLIQNVFCISQKKTRWCNKCLCPSFGFFAEIDGCLINNGGCHKNAECIRAGPNIVRHHCSALKHQTPATLS